VMRRVAIVAAAVAGLLVGGVATLALQGRALPPAPVGVGNAPLVASMPAAPSTFLVWVPRGLPDGFAARIAALPKIDDVAVVNEDDAWLRRSWSATGEVVDRPPAGDAIPLDTASVDPMTFARFVPAADRPSIAALAGGEAILGATSAGLRGLGVGSILRLGGEDVRVAAILPDQLVGAAEVVVSERMGARIGVTHARYALVRPDPGRLVTPEAFRHRLTGLLPVTLGIDRAVQVRAPGDTPFFRAGDAVLPPVIVKSLFGEFAARPARRAGTIEIDPGWVSTHIVTTRVPVLGRVTCNRAMLPQLQIAMRRLRSAGLSDAIRSYEGCFMPRYIGWSDANMLSYHSWGIAFDVNVASNIRGSTPHQDPAMVRLLGRWGFAWGGSWIVPDGNHFEFHRAVTATGAA
jgi:D-alanyl-D-alanine carboxypeptidase-like protein